MKKVISQYLCAALFSAGIFISPQLGAQTPEGPIPEPESPASETVVASVEETEVVEPAPVEVSVEAPEPEAPVSEEVETPEPEAIVETDSVVEASGGTIVEAEETITITPAPQKSEVIPVESQNTFYTNYVKDRLRIGTRVLWYSLTDTESGEEFDGSFIGSINRTTEDQDPAPIYFYAEYAITPYFGIGMSYDQFKVVTLDSGGGDGTFELDGPILYGFGRFENGSAFTPFAELGIAFYGTDFDAKDAWTFSDGGTNVINRFETENTTGFVLGGGLDIQIIEHFSLNLYLRYVSVDLDVDYYFTPASNTTPSATATFPGDHFAYGIGAAYTF